MAHIFTFDDIAGRPATLDINDRGNHMVVTWGDMVITDASGYTGFWETFTNSSKGAARDAAPPTHPPPPPRPYNF